MPPRAPALPPDERRRSIVAAALPLLRVKGVQVSTTEIAQAAGVAEGTLFRVFDNKDEIIHAVIDDVMDPAHTIEDLAAIDRTDPLPDRMTAIVRILHARIADVAFLMGVLHASGVAHSRPRHTHAQHKAHSETLRDAIVGVLSSDAPRLRQSPEATASLLRSVSFATAHPLLSDGVVTDPEAVVDFLLHGLLTDAPVTPATEGDRTCCSG
ncbi:TetR/AcrR family transcriptional regulator [Granulicoccus sp. GXG6511]|uniref:TetR/AcrR family transcriptional regulator n=1 Tax=Granulicoccus sp. GXG6511 TaxID=3381351 RepID=UPI003D7C4543